MTARVFGLDIRKLISSKLEIGRSFISAVRTSTSLSLTRLCSVRSSDINFTRKAFEDY